MRSQHIWLAVLVALALSHTASAQVLYQESFDTDPLPVGSSTRP